MRGVRSSDEKGVGGGGRGGGERERDKRYPLSWRTVLVYDWLPSRRLVDWLVGGWVGGVIVVAVAFLFVFPDFLFFVVFVPVRVAELFFLFLFPEP